MLAAENDERGKHVVLILDEAHLLDTDQLEELRLLTNADMDSRSPFACLLIGQPTLRRRMKLGTFAALDQRIALRYAMPGMTREETGDYNYSLKRKPGGEKLRLKKYSARLRKHTWHNEKKK